MSIHQAMITLNLGEVYLNQGDLDLAASLQSAEPGYVAGTRLYVCHRLAAQQHGCGGLAEAEDPDVALTLLQKSLELFQQINSGDFLPEVYRHMAEAHLGRAELDAALSCAQQSLVLAQEQEMRLEEGATRRVLGQVYRGLHELAPAEQELDHSLRILEELNSRYRVGQTLVQLALLRREQGRSAEADAALARAITIFQELGAQLDLQEAQSHRKDGDYFIPPKDRDYSIPPIILVTMVGSDGFRHQEKG